MFIHSSAYSYIVGTHRKAKGETKLMFLMNYGSVMSILISCTVSPQQEAEWLVE